MHLLVGGGLANRATLDYIDDMTTYITADEITASVMKTLNYGDESVSVGFQEISPADWAENVYEPDIRDRWSTLYKKPGYRM